MPRRHTLSHTIECDRDLTRLSNSRVTITRLRGNRYYFQSDLRLWRSEMSSFVERFIRSRLGTPAWIVGNCSRPDGYLFDRDK